MILRSGICTAPAALLFLQHSPDPPSLLASGSHLNRAGPSFIRAKWGWRERLGIGTPLGLSEQLISEPVSSKDTDP